MKKGYHYLWMFSNEYFFLIQSTEAFTFNKFVHRRDTF